MSNGRLGLGVTTANVDASIYIAPTNCSYVEATIDILNPTVTNAIIKIALSNTTTPVVGEYIEDGANIPANGGMLSRTNVFLSPGEHVIVNSSVSGNQIRVSGKEIVR